MAAIVKPIIIKGNPIGIGNGKVAAPTIINMQPIGIAANLVKRFKI
ncbi:hypothetical protein [Kordiimonas sp. SCSIO 12610]|nr:hypothetical protein [Kordiimonas sp. SCSIO 12610]UTW54929.1 hypothetical protein KFF44_14145 [Kordiimonas sp. SCSIO 12610]